MRSAGFASSAKAPDPLASVLPAASLSKRGALIRGLAARKALARGSDASKLKGEV